MTFDLPRILDSKRAYRQTLAGKSIAEKLRMLDALRECALSLRQPAHPAKPGVVRESSAKYGPPAA